MLIYIYTEQEAWVKWGDEKSGIFRISNGTRQGSVLSPTLFAVYIDELITDLRKLGLGCHMGGMWIGACGFADDVILLAPSRSAMVQMLKTCEQFALKNHLQFSTDPNPVKSKSKSIFMTGPRLRHTPKPAPLQLYEVDLPWVEKATHLGHELHQECNMEYDTNCKRGKFIENTTAIRETFKFADPTQVLQAVQVYCCDLYGGMLWNLFGEKADQIFRCWNTSVKMCWDVPRSTHTYFVNNLLADNFMPLRNQAMTRYIKFYRSLLSSPCKEVAVVSRIVGRNAGSNTGLNLLNIHLETSLNPRSSQLSKFKEHFQTKPEVPAVDLWRLPLLEKYLKIRNEQNILCENTDYITSLINSLCSS